MTRPPPRSPLFPYTPLFRSRAGPGAFPLVGHAHTRLPPPVHDLAVPVDGEPVADRPGDRRAHAIGRDPRLVRDRKSTRLNSSHMSISYAVFCLKKKKTKQQQ